MNLSDHGAKFIADFEGFSSKPYRDPVGVWTIGYGSTRGVGPNTPPMSQQQALARLKREVQETYGAAVNRLGLPLNQNQFDAQCSFTYNCGTGAIASSTTVGKRLRAKDWKGTGDAMLAWNKAGGKVLAGLVRRREAERKMFLSGGQPGKPSQPAGPPKPVVEGIPGVMPQLNYVFSIKQNQRVHAVKVWQERMKKIGFPKIEVDGVFGSQSDALCKDLQRGQGPPPKRVGPITADGVVGAATWKKCWGQ